jgi:hypothetical protein
MDVEATKYDPNVPVAIESRTKEGEIMEIEEEEGQQQKDGTKIVVLGKEAKNKKGDKKVKFEQSELQLPDSMEIEGNVRLSSAIKKAVKKRKRLQHKLGFFIKFADF